MCLLGDGFLRSLRAVGMTLRCHPERSGQGREVEGSVIPKGNGFLVAKLLGMTGGASVLRGSGLGRYRGLVDLQKPVVKYAVGGFYPGPEEKVQGKGSTGIDQITQKIQKI